MSNRELVYDFLRLPFSQKRFIAERYGITRTDPNEPDLEVDKRLMKAVSEQGKLDEFAELVAAARHKIHSN